MVECSNECLTCHENPNNCTACSDVAFLNGTKCIILEYYYKDEFNSLFSISIFILKNVQVIVVLANQFLSVPLALMVNWSLELVNAIVHQAIILMNFFNALLVWSIVWIAGILNNVCNANLIKFYLMINVYAILTSIKNNCINYIWIKRKFAKVNIIIKIKDCNINC